MLDVVLMLPCLNEERTIKKVLDDFSEVFERMSLNYSIWVCDNGSTDSSVSILRDYEISNPRIFLIINKLKGKGATLRNIKSCMPKSKWYLIVDSDDTYSAGDFPMMWRCAKKESVDMVIGCRLKNFMDTGRRLNYIGNRFITWTINFLFASKFSDSLSGYRLISNEFMKNLEFKENGFEVESEICITCSKLKLLSKNVECRYSSRPVSNLRPFRDGFKILKYIFKSFIRR